MQWWRDWKPHKWMDVHFALEQYSGPEGNKDGILFIYYNFHEEKKVCLCISWPILLCFTNLLNLTYTNVIVLIIFCFLSFLLYCHCVSSTSTPLSMRSPSWFLCSMTPNTPLPSTLRSGPNRGGQFDWQRPQNWKCMTGYVCKPCSIFTVKMLI